MHPGFEGEGQPKLGYTAGRVPDRRRPGLGQGGRSTSGALVSRVRLAAHQSRKDGFHEVKLVVQPGVFLLIVSEDGEPTFMRVLDDDTVRVPEKYGETWPWPPVSLPRARAIGEAWRALFG